MNEAFSDLSVINEFSTNEDYMPFIHSLKENTIKGSLYMSIFGSGTCNSEFEYLTGNSMSFLQNGIIAYTQVVKDKLPNMTYLLKEQGYKGNLALHPYLASGWNRDGLALRAVDWLLRRSGEQQRLLLILTDANPNDDTRLPGTGNQVFSRDYSGRPAVADAAEEATALRRHGNPPLCLFSGREGDLSSARTIYGRDVVRLPSVGWFAQTVGKIIQGRLQALES